MFQYTPPILTETTTHSIRRILNTHTFKHILPTKQLSSISNSLIYPILTGTTAHSIRSILNTQTFEHILPTKQLNHSISSILNNSYTCKTKTCQQNNFLSVVYSIIRPSYKTYSYRNNYIIIQSKLQKIENCTLHFYSVCQWRGRGRILKWPPPTTQFLKRPCLRVFNFIRQIVVHKFTTKLINLK